MRPSPAMARVAAPVTALALCAPLAPVSASAQHEGGTVSIETPRNGTPPNQALLTPGLTTGPVVGATWDPQLYALPGPSLLDVLGWGTVAVDLAGVFGAPSGTLLCLPDGGVLSFPPTGAVPTTLAIPLPATPGLVGQCICTQAGYVDPVLGVQLTNALDICFGDESPPAPTIDGFAPACAAPGDTVTVTGSGFVDVLMPARGGAPPDDDLNLCVQVGDGTQGALAVASAVTDTSFDLTLVAAAPGLSAGAIRVEVGTGTAVSLALPPTLSLGPDGARVWQSVGNKSGASESDLCVLAPAPARGVDGPFFGGLADSGDIEVTLLGGDCPPGTAVTFGAHFVLSTGELVNFDYLHVLTDAELATLVECANTQCQVFQQALFEATGVFVPCTTSVDGSTVTILVGPPLGQTYAAGLMGIQLDRP